MDPTLVLASQQLAWQSLQNTSNKWFHNPDFLALRACLATAKSLDIETRPVWLMLIAPSSCGKSDFYLPCASAYVPHEQSDDVSIGGLLSGSFEHKGDGVLKRLSPKGLWIFSDFTSLLNAPEEKRNAVLGAHRRIYDGEYGRAISDGPPPWRGRIHVLAACTPGIERFHRVNADLGERMVQIRVDKQPPSNALLEKILLQTEHHAQFHRELIVASGKVLRPNTPISIELPFSYQRLILSWAEFIATCRTSVGRNFKDEITSVGHEEGAGRLFQQLVGIVKGDAANLGQTSVTGVQMELVKRIAYDCLPWARRAVLQAMPVREQLDRGTLKEFSHISHNYTFDQTLDELVAIGVLERAVLPDRVILTLKKKPQSLLLETEAVDSKGVQLTPPQMGRI
jgi:hypothetical protein